LLKLEGKTAVITGGSSGIGLASARLLVEHGAFVVIAGRRQSELDQAEHMIGRNIATVQADVSNLDDLDRLFARVSMQRGSIDILVASAGFSEMATLSEVTPAHFDATFGLNARGTFFTMQKALPLFNDGGAVVLIGSSGHLKGIPAYNTYAASKAAQRSFARSWAAELAPRNIRVNTLSPGFTDTPMIDAQAASPAEARALKRQIEEMVPLGRIGRADEIARAVLFLASSDGSFCTGIDLVADGGHSQI
jgi:NAD(P)-dependent dehydrogenase (short-subunit alcohol dehydrogenase family)